MNSMSLTPDSGEGKAAFERPSKTWGIDFSQKQMAGYVDQTEALLQSIVIRLQTQLGKFAIFSTEYGLPIAELANGSAVEEAEQYIRETLLQDDRIEEVYDIVYSPGKENGAISFRVKTNLAEQSLAVQI